MQKFILTVLLSCIFIETIYCIDASKRDTPQQFCASKGVNSPSYFCNSDNSGYFYCLNGPWAPQSSYSSCPSSTTCQCGSQACPSDFGNPCRTAPTQTEAQQFCDSVAPITIPQGYYCANDGQGFYQCLSDSSFTSQDAYQDCPLGTACTCPYGVDCSYYGSASQHSPCTFPVTNNGCSGHPFNCQSEGGITPCSHSCTDMGSYCFMEADTLDGNCANNAFCSDLSSCTTNSDCPADHFCSVHTCCGEAGVCLQTCS